MKILGLVSTLVLVTILTLMGCGRKGALVLPEAQTPPQVEVTSPDSPLDTLKDKPKDSLQDKKNQANDPQTTD